MQPLQLHAVLLPVCGHALSQLQDAVRDPSVHVGAGGARCQQHGQIPCQHQGVGVSMGPLGATPTSSLGWRRQGTPAPRYPRHRIFPVPTSPESRLDLALILRSQPRSQPQPYPAPQVTQPCPTAAPCHYPHSSPGTPWPAGSPPTSVRRAASSGRS